MKNKKILLFDTKPYDKQFFDVQNKDYGFKIKYFNGHLNQDTASFTKGYEAICVFVNDVVDSEVISHLVDNNVKIIALRCAGYNNVDLKSAFQKIHIVRVPGYSPHAVAEHAVALILSLNRMTHKAYHRTRDGNFSINGLIGFDMYGKTAGVIGTGKIGKCLINILKGFGMNILAFDAFPDSKYAQTKDISYVKLSELYAKSDIISLHCPLNKDTHHLINKTSIQQMKEGVMLINTGRGGLINTQDLINGLKSGKIGSAGLDVYEEESEYFFEDFSAEIVADDVLARLLTFNNVLVTSHQAFFTQEALHNIAETTLNNVKSFFTENKLANEICYACGEDPKNCRKQNDGECFTR